MRCGSTWLRRGGTALREVPPAIVRSEMNYLLSAAYPALGGLRNLSDRPTPAIRLLFSRRSRRPEPRRSRHCPEPGARSAGIAEAGVRQAAVPTAAEFGSSVSSAP